MDELEDFSEQEKEENLTLVELKKEITRYKNGSINRAEFVRALENTYAIFTQHEAGGC